MVREALPSLKPGGWLLFEVGLRCPHCTTRIAMKRVTIRGRLGVRVADA